MRDITAVTSEDAVGMLAAWDARIPGRQSIVRLSSWASTEPVSVGEGRWPSLARSGLYFIRDDEVYVAPIEGESVAVSTKIKARRAWASPSGALLLLMRQGVGRNDYVIRETGGGGREIPWSSTPVGGVVWIDENRFVASVIVPEVHTVIGELHEVTVTDGRITSDREIMGDSSVPAVNPVNGYWAVLVPDLDGQLSLALWDPKLGRRVGMIEFADKNAIESPNGDLTWCDGEHLAIGLSPDGASNDTAVLEVKF